EIGKGRNNMSYEALQQSIIGAVASITGHDPADIGVAMSLEADLGMDSIKMVTLLQALQELIPADRQDRFREAVPAEPLLQAQTIEDLTRILRDWSGAGASSVEESKAAPAAGTPDPCQPAPVITTEVPLLYSQYPFLVGHFAISTCSLCTRVRLRGPDR